MLPSRPISVAFDIKRLVDAVANQRPYQGITRYTLRLLQELDRREDVLLRPVYLQPLDPERLGWERAIRECAALEEMESSFGRAITLPWNRRGKGTRWLRTINRLESCAPSLPGMKRAFSAARRRIVATGLSASGHPLVTCDLFHSPVNPLPPRERTPAPGRVLTVHDCIYLKRPEFHPLPGRTPAIQKALDSLDPLRDCVICDSENTRRDLHEFLDIDPERTCVVPLAADETFFAPDSDRAREALRGWGVVPGRYVLALAQAEVRKNIVRLAAAFRAVWTRHPEYQLLLISSTRPVAEIHDMLVEEELMFPQITIVSGVDDDLLAGLYAQAAAFAYVPLYEGFGIPPLEAMAAGCPLVVADNSSLPEVVGEAGLYVDATDFGAIAAALEQVLWDPLLRCRLVSAGRERARMFSWSRTARETVAVYHRLMAESPGQPLVKVS